MERDKRQDNETTEQDEACGARATRRPVHPGDLEEGRPHTIISNRQRNQS